MDIIYVNKMLTLDCARSSSRSESLTNKFLSFIDCDQDIGWTLLKNRKRAQRKETRNSIEKKKVTKQDLSEIWNTKKKK